MGELVSGDGPIKDTSFVMPQPEQVGFVHVPEMDIAGSSSTMGGLQVRSVDTTAVRRGKWVNWLSGIGNVSSDTQKRIAAVERLKQLEDSARLSDKPNADHLAEVFGFARSVIGNFSEPATLKRALMRGGGDALQESILRTGGDAERAIGDDTDLNSAVSFSLELAREMYLQGHKGEYFSLSSS